MVINDPSLCNIPFLDFPQQVQQLYDAGIRFFHLDIADGHYADNLIFAPKIVGELRSRYPDSVLDVHLMVDDPAKYVPVLADMGADYIAFHTDSTRFVVRTLDLIRKHGVKAGVCINPSQTIEHLEPFAGEIDHLVFMSVEPGFPGQKFLPGAMPRFQALSEWKKAHGYDFMVIADGGITYDNLPELVQYGADAVVTNIYTIFNQPDGIASACRRFDRFVAELEQKNA